MQADKCKSVKESILRFLTDHTIVEDNGNLCVATIPIPTVDGRLVDVFIEQKIGDYFLVSDGGKAANELIIQGVEITDAVGRSCESLANTFGVSWVDEGFQSTCKHPGLNQAIMSVAACSSLATFHLVGHEALSEENPVREQFGQALKKWARKRAKIQERVTVDGSVTQHTFDFVINSKARTPVAVSVLMPTGGSRAAAERFGFKIQDIRDASAGKWRRLVVKAKAESWSSNAQNIISRYADYIIEVPADRKPVESQIASAMEAIA